MIYPFNAGEVFKIALNIEDNGFVFYEQAAAKPFSEDVKKLFNMLGQAELAHKRFFTALMDALPQKNTGSAVWDPEDEVDLYLKMMADDHVFVKKPEALVEQLKLVTTPQEALQMAMQFEKDTIVFFLELRRAADGTASREHIEKLVYEEQDHLKDLAMILHKMPRI